MEDMSFDYQIDEFMVYCRSKQLREKTMSSYEQALRLFQRWCESEMNITKVDQVSESVMRRYINDLQERGNLYESAEEDYILQYLHMLHTLQTHGSFQ